MFSNQEFANLFERDFSNYNLLSLLLMIVWIISITYLTYFYYFNAKLIKEYKVEVECYIKQYKEKKDDSNCIWTDFPKFDIFRLSRKKYGRGLMRSCGILLFLYNSVLMHLATRELVGSVPQIVTYIYFIE